MKKYDDGAFSVEFETYLEYLFESHILINEEQPDVVLVEDEEEEEDDEGTIEYMVRTIRIPVPVQPLLYNDECIAFSYIDGRLFSSISVEVIEST